MTEQTQFNPTWTSPPGDTIVDILEARSWTQQELATRTGYSPKHISLLVGGNAALTEDAALRLEHVLGGTARFWLAREAQYREALARAEADEVLRSQTDWLDELPLTDMRRWGWISRTRDKVEQMGECLRFFGVASVDAWRAQYAAPLTAFRRSDAYPLDSGSVATWIRRCELAADSVACAPFDVDALSAAVPSLRTLTLVTDPREFFPRLVETCAACGVAVVTAPAPKGCPASGMTRMLGRDKALLALSLRYKWHDHFWFSFFHEVGHLVKHGRRLLAIEGLDGLPMKLEVEADAFASQTLIPDQHAERLASLRHTDAIVAFANDIAMHPGVVVGRLQHDGVLRYNQHNGLRIRYEWARGPSGR